MSPEIVEFGFLCRKSWRNHSPSQAAMQLSICFLSFWWAPATRNL